MDFRGHPGHIKAKAAPDDFAEERDQDRAKEDRVPARGAQRSRRHERTHAGRSLKFLLATTI